MQDRIVGQVQRVNGPVITVKGITDAMMMELVSVGEQRLVGELVKLWGHGLLSKYMKMRQELLLETMCTGRVCRCRLS